MAILSLAAPDAAADLSLGACVPKVDGPDIADAGGAAQDMVRRLRLAVRLTASNQFALEGQAGGDDVVQGRVDAVGNTRLRCGCTLHYPDLLWQ